MIKDSAETIGETSVQDLANLFPADKQKEFLDKFSPKQMQQVVNAAAKLMEETDMDIGFDLVNGVEVAKQVAKEQGVSPETVYKDDVLYKEYVQRRWTPDTYAAGTLYSFGEKFDPEKQARAFLKYQIRLQSIEKGYGDRIEESIEHATNVGFNQYKKHPEFVARVDQASKQYEDLATSFTRFQIERFWGQGALDTLPENLRSRLASSNPEMEQIDLADSYRGIAGALIIRDRNEEALHPAQKAVDLDPNNPKNRIILGSVHGVLRNYETAKENIVKAIDLDPQNPSYKVILGSYYVETGQYEETVEILRTTIGHLDPEENKATLMDGYYALSASLRKLERYEEALEPAKKLVDMEPDHALHVSLLADTYAGNGMNEEELTTRLKAVELDPTQPTYWNDLGEAQANLGMHGDSRDSYSTANALQWIEVLDSQKDQEKLGVCYYGIAISRWKLGRIEETVELVQKAVEMNPQSAVYRDLLGNAQGKLRNWEEAAEAYKETIALSDHETPPEILADRYGDLGASLWNAERPDEAIESLNKAVELDPENARYRGALGEVNMGIENYEAAEDNLTIAAELDSTNPLRFDAVAAFYEHLGKYEEAMKATKKSIESSDPEAEPKEFAGRCARLAFSLRRLERYDEALDAQKKAVEFAPEDPISWNNLGITHKTLGNYEEAEKAYIQALVLDPQDSYPRANLGEVKYHLGKYQQAEEHLTQAIVMDESIAAMGEPYYELALIQDKLEKSDAALSSLQRALEKADPENEQELIKNIRQKMDELLEGK